MVLLRLLLLVFISFPLLGEENSESKSIEAKVEFGIYLPKAGGSISNLKSTAYFKDDLGYTGSQASYLAFSLVTKYDYVPCFKLSYFNMNDNQDATLASPATFVSIPYASGVGTVIDYQVLNTVIYYDLKSKGNYVTFFGSPFYTGDLEFDVGVNIKTITWKYKVRDLTDSSNSSAFINVNELVFAPSIGVKYYLYDFIAYAGASALSFSTAKSTSYEAELDYRVVGGLYLSIGYMYNQFEALDKLDTVDFSMSGYKASFKYAF
ncbi:hypothetical protein GJV85_00270 [Sulfurimonas aquatica]|uniref:Uncharacterized protein n=1 Tax=Sulfurimonas aquatica TaxID=2672570 RepID=A0A975AXY3_9BACT|nr:hypothetical protein [Sulfurimonas aquatica]QSZ40616.1 hypothetical protein GJV85_00270 [Sulfurimonas aquatica]